jgi:1,2-dihydroxy-3-keto-5-methylthiopentene dioxygenase
LRPIFKFSNPQILKLTMAILSIPSQNRSISDPNQIRAFLTELGVHFDQWRAEVEFSDDADQETILKAYEYVLKPYMEMNGYHVADVININSATPSYEAVRAKFLSEHTHTEDEVRFFVDGQGYFWFNVEDGKTPVFNVLLQAGDLISVPANTKHWFDAGEHNPFVKTIRIFIDPSGWTPIYTGSKIEQEFL